MRLSRYAQRTRALGDTTLNAAELDAFEDAVTQGEDLVSLVKARAQRFPSLTPRNLLLIWRAAQSLRDHKQCLDDVTARRKALGLPPIAQALLAQTVARHEVAVLERAESLCPPGQAAEHRRRDAVKEALLVWNACVAIARRDTTILARQAVGGEPLGPPEPFNEVGAERWLALRHGERDGQVTLSLKLPVDALLAQLAAHIENLRAIAGGRDARQTLDALILADLELAMIGIKDDEAGQKAVQAASEKYLELLCSSRPRVTLVCGVWPGQGELGLAIVGRDGRVAREGAVPSGDDPAQALRAFIADERVDGLAVPTEPDAEGLLDRLIAGLGGQPAVHRIDAVAMDEALTHVTEEVEPAVGHALVLARRCIRPMRTWSQVDPVQLRLADHQRELDESRLRRALDEVRSLALAGIKPDELLRIVSPPSTAPAPPAPKATPTKAAPTLLNPLIKNVEDLRPGMKVNGVITRVQQIGAFVHIGLPQDGLVHVSELADHFVKDPNEVAKVGQQVQARVLGVDRARGRISLSLKAEKGATGPETRPGDRRSGPPDVVPAEPPRRSGGGHGGGRGGGGPGRGGPATGAPVPRPLPMPAELDALFRKR